MRFTVITNIEQYTDQNELKQLYEADKAILDIPEKLSRYAAPTGNVALP